MKCTTRLLCFQVYDEKEDCWQESTPMKHHRAHLSVAGFNGEMFAMGGMGIVAI